MAVDVIPFPVDWDDLDRFKYLGFFTLGLAEGMGIPVLWGADWNMNYILTDERFIDLPHYELIGGDAYDG